MKKTFILLFFVIILSIAVFSQILVSKNVIVYPFENNKSCYIDWTNRTYVITESIDADSYDPILLTKKALDKIPNLLEKTSINSKYIKLDSSKKDEYYKKINDCISVIERKRIVDENNITLKFTMSMDKVLGYIIANDTSLEERTTVNIDPIEIEENKRNIYKTPHLIDENRPWDGTLVYDAREYKNIRFCVCPVIADENGKIIYDTKKIYDIYKNKTHNELIQNADMQTTKIKGLSYVNVKNETEINTENINNVKNTKNPLIITPIFISENCDICLSNNDINFLMNFNKSNKYQTASLYAWNLIDWLKGNKNTNLSYSDLEGEIWNGGGH